jgi:hypothetical protein
MSAIPPNVIGSVLQSGVTQDIQSRDRDRVENDRRDATRALTGSGADDIIEIEQTDTDDTQVHPDTMGAGGQGRHDAAPEEDSTPDAVSDDTAEGLTFDDNGHPHLDISV